MGVGLAIVEHLTDFFPQSHVTNQVLNAFFEWEGWVEVS